MFRELPRPVELEEEVLRIWKEERTFEASIAASQGREPFVFYEGPPTANGTPHNGHVLTRVIKDLFPRYRTMRGFLVERRAGWDTHGLPVEVEVEKELGWRGKYANTKEAVAAFGLDHFARACVQSVFRYTSDWERMTERIGFWLDLGSAYVTYHRSYVESVWWALAELYRRGLLYQGRKVVWWWPQGGTALSAGEVGEGYRDTDDPSVTVRFRVRGKPGTSLLAWTTTPWTLPSNAALAVGPDIDYAMVRVGDETLIAAVPLAPEGQVVGTVKGADLVGWEYEPLYDFGELAAENVGGTGRYAVVIPGRHVSLDQGTGIVHTAPGYGEDDFESGKEHGLGLLQLVGPDGRFAPESPEWLRGLTFKAGDKPIVRDLHDRGLLFSSGTVRHSYPFAPRSKDDALLQMARPGWFIRTSDFKDQALANNAAVRWLPEHIQEGRFGDFLRNNVDWALSRERFWGTPLPIWTCAGCGAQEAFESVARLESRGACGFESGLDPHLVVHKPWIDRVTVPCACGAQMRRVPEVVDCWFDSGCMPFAQFGFPHAGRDEFARAFPCDFISEAVDQTRGWFYSLLMISTLLFDEETCRRYSLAPAGWPRPYRTCVVLGHVCDLEGKKESKSAGNYTSPDLVLVGRMKQRVVADPSLQPGQVGMNALAVKSIDLAPGERMRLSATEAGAAREVDLVPGASRGKETVALCPADIEALRIADDTAWLHAPFDPPGADAFRWLFYASNPPWTNTRISLRAIREGQREFHLRLANVFQFFTIYANIARFDPATTPRPPATHVLDRWIRAECDALVRTMTASLDGYLVYEAARALADFTDALSNWYVRRSRARFWGEGEDLAAALWTLYDVLGTVALVAAPFVPFLAEAMHRRLGLPGGSVHLCGWPEAAPAATEGEAALASDMALVRELASLGLAARARVGVRVRQPLRAAEIVLASADRSARLAPLLSLLQEELNVREIRFGEDAGRFVVQKLKPNYPRLGKRLGRDMKSCAAALGAATQEEIFAFLKSGTWKVGDHVLDREDVLVDLTPREGFQATGSASGVVALHADLDDDLREEGLAREVLSRLQARRKELELGYAQRIRVRLAGDAILAGAAKRFSDHLCHEALVVDLWIGVDPAATITDDVDGHPIRLDVEAVDG